MEDIRRYIDNSLFIKWVYDPDEYINEYWDFYMDKHPDEKEFLEELRTELALFRISNRTLSPERKKILSDKITRKIREKQRKNSFTTIGRILLKYAALLILFAGFGAGLVYYHYQSKSQIDDFAQYFEMPEMSNKPILVLSDGSNVNLSQPESTVNYATHDQIVVNNDTIIQVKKKNKKVDTVPNQLIIPYGSLAKVVLSDHSVVWLNAGSRLIYPSVFSGNEREVLLFGEAFFQVEKDEARAFIVKTTNYRIKVLGTQFNVSAYPSEDISQTVLTEGSIELNLNNNGWFDKGVVLTPNEMFSFNKELNESKIRKVQPEKYVLWRDGIVKFENEDLSRVLKKIERFYNIQIKLANPLDGTIKIDGKLNLKEDKYEVLHYVSKVARRKYVEQNEHSFTLE